MSYSLGVDLGTTFTAAAMADGSEPTMVGTRQRALQIPSVLFLADDGFVAVRQLSGEGSSNRTGWCVSSRVAERPTPLLVGGSPFSAGAPHRPVVEVGGGGPRRSA